MFGILKIFDGRCSASRHLLRIIGWRNDWVRQIPMLDAGVITPSETAFALKVVTEMDLLRLKAISQPGLVRSILWEDLLQEAFARVISGSRRRPQGVAMIAFMAGVMRSLKAEHLAPHAKGVGLRPNDLA